MRWSIRWRLTVWNTLALAVLLVALAGLIYALLAQALYAAVDRKLLACWNDLEHEPAVARDRTLLQHWIGEFWEHEGIACTVYDERGLIVDRLDKLAPDAVPPFPGAAPDEPQLSSATLPIMGRQRLLVARLPGAADGRVVVLMAGLEETDRTLGQLRTALFLAVPVMLVASALVAYLLAWRALAPVTAISQATRSITADALHHRLPVPRPHDELGQLSATINAMIARLEQSFTEMRRFTADASHELRTPLTVLRTEVELALGKALRPEETQALLGSVLEECQHLTRLTDQLLTLARRDAGLLQPHCEPVGLTALLQSVAETLQPLAEVKGLTLQVISGAKPGTDIVAADAGQLRQVFVNLIDNAVKYTPGGGAVTVELDADTTQFVIRVRDTGEGIPAEHLPRVFERFYRVDMARSRELGGSGLGLSIARSIVEAHGGQIELESTPGTGTTCTVRLPRPEHPGCVRSTELESRL
ncbi:MAG: heavy metal sensor histidine kinase [Gemmataceae bacterium]|nr:heavy metal sensor histidine kinase [Gemmataceae bacterium]